MTKTEVVARALCRNRKQNPDLVLPRDKKSFEGVGGSIMASSWTAPNHFLWEHFVSDAEAAIAAIEEFT